MSDKESKEVAAANEANAKEVAKIEADNLKAAKAGGLVTPDEANAAGYMGTVMSPFPNEVHLAKNEKLRAEIFGAAEVPEGDGAKDGPFASIEAAKRSLRVSNDLATVRDHPTLRGAAVNADAGNPVEKKDK